MDDGGMILLPQAAQSAPLMIITDTSMEADRLSGSHGLACTSDTSSGPVPTVSADAVNNLTVVPLTNMNSVSLAAAAAVAAEKQQLAGFNSSPQQGPQQQHQLEALRNRRRLLLTQAPHDCGEDAIRTWLNLYGPVEQLQGYGEGGAVLGSTCFLVTMATSEAAAAVLAAVLGSMQLPAALQKLSASWVLQPDDHGVVSSDGHAMPTPLAANADRTLFFAKVPPTAPGSEVDALFGSFGKLAEVNLFRAWAGAKHSKGCGLITYKDRNSAAAAIQQLHGEYIFPGSDCPMVVEWMDLKKQRPAAVVPAVDKPPMGCACDAYKLLLSNIPVGISETALVTTLSHFGPVVQLGLVPDMAGPCASGYVWFATKHAADLLLNRKAEPVWLRDPRTNSDLALSVKKTRRPGFSNGCSSTTSRINVGLNFHSNGPLSSTSNSSASYLPLMQMAGLQAAAAQQQSQDLQSNSARLAAAAAGMGNSGSLDAFSMLQNSNVMRLLPMHSPALMGPAAAVMLQGAGGANGGGGYMAHDVCEAMLDYCDSAGLNMGMPVHLQPAMAAQMANRLVNSIPGLQPRPMANSQVCCLPGGMVGNNSGQHCLSSPANISGFDEFEGSFAMPSIHSSGSNVLSSTRLTGPLPSSMAGPLAPQQFMAQQLQQQQHQQQQQFQQQQQQQAGGFKSVVVPISPYEVQLIAEHLSFFGNQSGAQVTITSLPGSGLAVMISGQPEQVSLAQSLLGAARGQC